MVSFAYRFRYLVKSRKEKQGGKSVIYLVSGGEQLKQQQPSPNSLAGLVSLFERVAAGYNLLFTISSLNNWDS